jgi:predicted MFS family arabinose efflux permease
MTLRQLKACCYGLTAVGTVATSYYLNYLFFYLRDRFGFGNRENLMVAALHGSIYIFSAWACGRFAERRGYLTSLMLGFGGLFLCMLAGLTFDSVPGQAAALVGYSIVLLLIWPAMEALTTAGEPDHRVPHMVGLYNVTWSLSGAVAYFTGGPLYDALGRGSVFALPAAMFLLQFLFVLRIRRRAESVLRAAVVPASHAPHPPEARALAQRVPPKVFLRMAWMANPFAYMAMYTLLAVMPALAQRLGLSPTRVGLFCSVWFFSRVVAFAVLWRWTGWHYRFRWMIGAFATIIVSFAAILLAPSLWFVVLGQIFFGFAAGLIYYSSLFYSMDVGEARGEHGGLHEAAIGIGICAGPAVGALSLQVFPHTPWAGTAAVSILLVAGLAVLTTGWARARARPQSR